METGFDCYHENGQDEYFSRYICKIYVCVDV